MTDLRDKIARAAYENRVALIESDAERQNWPAWDEHEEADADEWRDMADAVLAVLDDVRAEALRDVARVLTDALPESPSAAHTGRMKFAIGFLNASAADPYDREEEQ